MLLKEVKFGNTNTMLIEDNYNCLAYIGNAKIAVEISFEKADEILELSDEEFFRVIFNMVKKAEKQIVRK
jgi:hypothetical protein